MGMVPRKLVEAEEVLVVIPVDELELDELELDDVLVLESFESGIVSGKNIYNIVLTDPS